MPVCDVDDKLRLKLEKKDEDESLGFDGTYGSASSTASEALLAPFVGGGDCGCCFGGCVGVGAGRSGVVCEENLELKLFIHDDFFDDFVASWLTLSALGRPNRLGRFSSCSLLGDGLLGYALVVSFVGSTGVGGVTFGKEGTLRLLGSDRDGVTGVLFPVAGL